MSVTNNCRCSANVAFESLELRKKWTMFRLAKIMNPKQHVNTPPTIIKPTDVVQFIDPSSSKKTI